MNDDLQDCRRVQALEHRRAARDHEEHRARGAVRRQHAASNVWHTYNMNEVNIFENGFVNEFKNAQRNLAINAGRRRDQLRQPRPAGPGAAADLRTAFGARGSQTALPPTRAITNGGVHHEPASRARPGRSRRPRRATPTYVCRLFGSTFGPCATRGYNAPGPYPINVFLANPYAVRQGPYESGGRRLVHELSRAAAAAPPAIRPGHAA